MEAPKCFSGASLKSRLSRFEDGLPLSRRRGYDESPEDVLRITTPKYKTDNLLKFWNEMIDD
ncbi:hypothetical protein E4U60_001066 [Claviceps pazoutovae]|uniref:Uncharacterized protein n=1 Tax=Claviceps pazoutovae TaxID=1649127 RepID=A0A9P7MJN7_9HYPO|nr:hypothetical protein E4U60_001066 [Claviceps pazoutovae]